MDYTEVSKYISLILRHKPEVVGLKLDAHGWVNVDQLIEGVSRKYMINQSILEEIVETDNKQRYSFNADKTKIRANQGHSSLIAFTNFLPVPCQSTSGGLHSSNSTSTLTEGLIPKSRLYVHLSKDPETARQVGARHGELVLYVVSAGQMFRDGYKFYLSKNGVWLTKEVPVKYLERNE